MTTTPHRSLETPMSEPRCHCAEYRPTEADGAELRIHGTHTCLVFVEKGTGDLEVHSVLDDGCGQRYATFDDDQREAAQDLLEEVRCLRKELSEARAETTRLRDSIALDTAPTKPVGNEPPSTRVATDCDDCDWTFGCFGGTAPCHKRPLK
jgi:hypothetical protein